MSLNSFGEIVLNCEDDEFVLKVDKDIRFYLLNSAKNSVLLFPPVNSYRRFLIHKVCEIITATQPRPLSTFSIGAGENRRTVICHRYQLLVNLDSISLKRHKEAEFTWRYVERNSVPKQTTKICGTKCDMGVETAHHQDNSAPSSQQQTVEDLSISPTTSEENNSPGESRTKRSLFSRPFRRPDRAVYVPRAKRSQTTPPATTTATFPDLRSSEKKSDLPKSKSIDERHSNSPDSSYPVNQNIDEALTCNRLEHCEISPDCDLGFTSETNKSVETEEENTSGKNKKNLNNITMSNLQTKVLTIESAAGFENISTDKVDKDEKELIKASQEINRSNRKLIKQTFNSNVLEIEAASGSTEKSDTKLSENAEDDWDTLFDDNGDCLDPKMLEELTEAVGKVNIETPKTNYKAYQANVDLLSLEEFPHVLECSNFPVEFRDQDVNMIFSEHKQSGFEIKWVDDNHCLVVFSSAKIAADVLTMSHSFVRMKPLKEATAESRAKAKKCANSLQPYKQRPETCAALAKRLVSGALGVRVKATSEEREKERKVLREAKERKLLEKKQREDMWNN